MRQAVLMELPSSHDRLLPHLTVPLFTEAGCRGHCACNPNISTLAGTRRALIALYVRLSLIPPTPPPPSRWLTQRQHGCPAGPLCCSHPCITVWINAQRRSSRKACPRVITTSSGWDNLGTTTGRICSEST